MNLSTDNDLIRRNNMCITDDNLQDRSLKRKEGGGGGGGGLNKGND